MPTDQNNWTNPNQNTTAGNVPINPNENQNNWDFNLDLDWVALESSPENEENLSVDNLFDWWSSVPNESENNTDDLIENPTVDTVDTPLKAPVMPVEAPVEQLTETSVEQWIQDVVSQNEDITAWQVAENSDDKGEDDWLLQEDQAVQESENTESVEQTETVEANNETQEDMWVDLSWFADGLESKVEETPVEDVSVSPVQAEMAETNNETQGDMWVDLGWFADGLESKADETPVEEIPVPSVQADAPVVNNESEENMWVDLGWLADVVDNGWTELDSPEAPVETQVDTINGMNENHEDDWVPTDSLTIENVWVPVVEDKAWDMVSDTWDFSGRKDGYVPNESEFQKMSNLLDNSKPWQVEIPNEVNTQVQLQWETVPTQEETKWVFNLDYVVSSLQDSEKSRVTVWSQNEVTMPNIDNQNNNMVEDTGVNNSIPVNNSPENNVSENMVQNTAPITENVAPVQPEMNQVEVPQNNIPQWQGYVYQPQVVAPMPEASMQSEVMSTGETPTNQEWQVLPKKSHSGHTGLLIILVVICLLWVAGFILYKMYPDVVWAILWKNNISIEYQNNTSSVVLWDDDNSALTWDVLTWEVVEELTWDAELWDLWEQLLPDENLTWNENSQSTWWGLDDVLDPDTLAALLQWNDAESGTEKSWESVTELHNSAIDSDDMDTYKDLWLLLDESNSDKSDVLKKLNDYKAQGIIYQDWGTENDNQGVYKYGTYIVKKATAMIESIETTGEMDMNEVKKTFDTFDWYLSKLESLKSN